MILDKFRELRDRHPWTFAKTYSKTAPHRYIVKEELKSDKDKKTFEEFVKYIRENGYSKYFFKKKFIYFDFEGYSYWTYGDPINVTRILNKVEINWKKILM